MSIDDRSRQEFAASHPEWEIDGEVLRRTFRFADFNEAMGFVVRVALLAEREWHHPDLAISWNTVTVSLTTHSAGGLTDKDLDLAAAISAIVAR